MLKQEITSQVEAVTTTYQQQLQELKTEATKTTETQTRLHQQQVQELKTEATTAATTEKQQHEQEISEIKTALKDTTELLTQAKTETTNIKTTIRSFS